MHLPAPGRSSAFRIGTAALCFLEWVCSLTRTWILRLQCFHTLLTKKKKKVRFYVVSLRTVPSEKLRPKCRQSWKNKTPVSGWSQQAGSPFPGEGRYPGEDLTAKHELSPAHVACDGNPSPSNMTQSRCLSLPEVTA